MTNLEFLLHGVVLVSGILGAIGTGYLLYADTVVVHYATFFRLVTAGLLLFSLSAPVVVRFAPDAIHAIHALAALCISGGLYTLIRPEVENVPDFAGLSGDLAEDAD